MVENKEHSNSNRENLESTNLSTEYNSYARFMAGVTAHYLDTKAKYDPMSLFLSSKIDIVPYQIYDFSKLMSEERTNGNIRALIAYETGLGKTILVGMIIKELLTRHNQQFTPQTLKSNPRILIITPPTVLPQFRDEMKRKFGIDFIEFSTKAPNFSNLMIASMETLKLAEWKEKIAEQSWDLIVVDEYHRISQFNLRGELIELITTKTKHFLALTATPHDGRSDRFAFRLKAIAASPLVIRRTKKEAVDVNNKKIFNQTMHEEKVEFPVGPEEIRFYNAAERYAKDRYQSSGAGALVAVVIGRAVSSSIRAGVKLLRRRCNRLLLGQLEEIAKEEFEDLSDKVREGEELSESDIERILSAKPENKDEIQKELDMLNPIIDQGKALLNSHPVDSKGLHLLELVKNLANEGRKVLVFTSFLETVVYLKDLLKKNGFQTEIITGAIDMEERNRIVEKLSTNPNLRVIIGTDAMGESLNLQSASVEINYEVPWSPVSYIQRVGRIWRLKQVYKDLYIHNFLPAFEVEKRVMEVILQKIKTINEEFGEVGLSVFGRELGSVDTLLQQAYSGIEVSTKVDKAFSKSVEVGKEVMEVLNKSMSLPSVVNVEELQRSNIINLDNAFSEDDARRFLRYLKEIGVASGVFPEKGQKSQSTYHVCKNGDYIRVETLSLEDEGMKAAINVGKGLLTGDQNLSFNYFKKLDGTVGLFQVKVNGKIVCKEIVLVTPEGVVPYPGFLGLAPDFSESVSNIYFTPYEDYKQNVGRHWLNQEISMWEESRKLKWDILMRATDSYRKDWLRKDLEKWTEQKPSSFEIAQETCLCRIHFLESQSEEAWMARYEVEMLAMQRATDYYTKKNYTVRDISRLNRGYDIECSRMDSILRVEVKGLKGAKYPELTQNEHRMAKFYAESFILYVVEISEVTREFAIPDPISNLKVEEIMKPVYRVSNYDHFQV